MVFWVVMTVAAATVAVAYGLIGRFGHRWGVPDDRARRFRSSSWLALGWVAVCIGHYVVAR